MPLIGCIILQTQKPALPKRISPGRSPGPYSWHSTSSGRIGPDHQHIDPFYVDGDINASNATAGSVIKIEQYTNTSLYTLAPGLALSRMVFMTKNLNGSTIPASAYVLWPWQRRSFANVSGAPLVAFGHGLSGATEECAPSHVRNLWYQYSAPFTLALQGYTVVAPDYAGLGIDHDAGGNFIPHQYLAAQAKANDLLYSVQAAQRAWPSLSKQFVIVSSPSLWKIVLFLT